MKTSFCWTRWPMCSNMAEILTTGTTMNLAGNFTNFKSVFWWHVSGYANVMQRSPNILMCTCIIQTKCEKQNSYCIPIVNSYLSSKNGMFLWRGDSRNRIVNVGEMSLVHAVLVSVLLCNNTSQITGNEINQDCLQRTKCQLCVSYESMACK